MRCGRAHGDTRPHHPHARQRGRVAVDAAARRHDILGLRRHEAAERHIVQMIVAERLPDIAFRPVMQLDRPASAGDRVGKFGAGAHVFDRQLPASDDPARLADTRKAVAAHARIAEGFGIFALEEADHVVGLGLAKKRVLCCRDRVERRFDMRHVDERRAASGKDKRKSVGADQAVLGCRRARPFDEFLSAWLGVFVDPFEHHHLRAVEWPVGRLAAGKTGLVGERSVAGCIHEARCRQHHVAVAGRELDRADAAAVAHHTA